MRPRTTRAPIGAPREKLEELHRAVAEALYEKVSTGTATPAEKRCAVVFLRNNGITNVPASRGLMVRLARVMRDREYIN